MSPFGSKHIPTIDLSRNAPRNGATHILTAKGQRRIPPWQHGGNRRSSPSRDRPTKQLANGRDSTCRRRFDSSFPAKQYLFSEETSDTICACRGGYLAVILMRFQAYKISGGRGVLKNAPSPGLPFPKNFRIMVSCCDRRSSASLTAIFKKFLVEGFGEAPSFKKGCPEFLYL